MSHMVALWFGSFVVRYLRARAPMRYSIKQLYTNVQHFALNFKNHYVSLNSLNVTCQSIKWFAASFLQRKAYHVSIYCTQQCIEHVAHNKTGIINRVSRCINELEGF